MSERLGVEFTVYNTAGFRYEISDTETAGIEVRYIENFDGGPLVSRIDMSLEDAILVREAIDRVIKFMQETEPSA